jgi:pyrimidine-nucleoside phosphorylase
MTPYEIIAKKRDGHTLTSNEIHYFIREFLKGRVKDYQMTAFLMAVFFRGMNFQETLSLTEAYLHSGKRLDLSDIPIPKIDKHSTGGVGDKVSLVLAPLAASLGLAVPMISGRGLGHTGGTLDKLESIPGFKVNGSLTSFKKQIRSIGVAMFGQTKELVPADRKIYSLRDVTATVNSIPLITASIMSKKLAEGIDGLVLDVKVGNGAVLPDQKQTETLASNMMKVGQAFGKKVVVYLTSMEQPLGLKIGNWLEVQESIECLQGRGPDDLEELVVELTTEMLLLAGLVEKKNTARCNCREALQNGIAFEKMLQLVRAQGGNVQVILHPDNYPLARYYKELKANCNGYLTGFDTHELGLISVALGAGRLQAKEQVDPQAGIILHKKIGDPVKAGDTLLGIQTNRANIWNSIQQRLRAAIKISDKPIQPPRLILKRLAS